MTELRREEDGDGPRAGDHPEREADIRNGTDFLGVNEKTRQSWMDAARQALAMGVWLREGRPLSDDEVLRRLQKRYPDGIPQGTLTIEDVLSARECMSGRVEGRDGRAPLPIIHHPESDGRWCTCSDDHHNGAARSDSPILFFLEKKIRQAGYTVSTRLE